MEIKVVITSAPNGGVKVEGPEHVLGNPIIMYGLFERAKDAIRDMHSGKEIPIALARGGIPNGIAAR